MRRCKHDWARKTPKPNSKDDRKRIPPNGYDDALTLERVDRDGHYEPNNCTWVSYKAQARNTVQNNLLTYKGKTMPLIEWVEKTGIKYSTLRSRVFVYGWSVEREPLKPR